jgi:RNA polymerase sigma-70 factor, ECF subfamily
MRPKPSSVHAIAPCRDAVAPRADGHGRPSMASDERPPAPGCPEHGADAFERLYDEHFAFVWRTSRLLGVSEDALEDAVQDVFAVVARQLAEFAGRAALRTWIFAIVQRTAANYRRRHRRKLKPLVPLAEGVAGHEPTPLAHAEAQAVADVIERYCQSLDPDRRALFVLVLLEEVPAPEAARALGVPLNTVYSRMRSLRAGLERALSLSEEPHE